MEPKHQAGDLIKPKVISTEKIEANQQNVLHKTIQIKQRKKDPSPKHKRQDTILLSLILSLILLLEPKFQLKESPIAKILSVSQFSRAFELKNARD